jgi:hypothetical protein
MLIDNMLLTFLEKLADSVFRVVQQEDSDCLEDGGKFLQTVCS